MSPIEVRGDLFEVLGAMGMGPLAVRPEESKVYSDSVECPKVTCTRGQKGGAEFGSLTSVPEKCGEKET